MALECFQQTQNKPSPRKLVRSYMCRFVKIFNDNYTWSINSTETFVERIINTVALIQMPIMAVKPSPGAPKFL